MLNTLKKVLEKRGLEYVNNFLNEEVIITEKLDTYRILFEQTESGLKFYKKDNSELNLIERVLTNIWEDAIIELSIILNETELPKDMVFGIAYSPVDKPIRLSYKNLPKYILTDVTKRDKDKKVIESFDYSEVIEWATKLNLGRPPVIFQGKLSEDQKNKIIKYGISNFDENEKIEDILGNSYSKAEIIEGIIIKSNDTLIQLESYEFGILNETYKNQENSRDFYDLTLLRIGSFLDSYKYPNISEGSSDEIYLQIICDMFNKYCEKGNISEDLDPSYLTPPSYGYTGDLNLLLLKDKKTISILEKGNKIHESIFKIMLSSFRKFKRPYGLLKESDIQKFNTFIYLINEKSGYSDLGNLPTVGVLNETRSDNVVIGSVKDRIKTDVDNMRVISSIQKAFKPIAPKVTKGKEKCIVYVIDPQPITNSHKENIKSLSNLWKVPVILSFVKKNKRVEGEKFHLSDMIKKAQLESFADKNRDLVPAFFALNSWDIIEIFEYCRPKYEPIAIITEEDKKSEFVLQLYFEEEVMGGRIEIEKDFNIGEITNDQQLLAYRTIEDKNHYSFKEVTPSSIWGLFNSMVGEYSKWNGSVPPQFEPTNFN